MEVGGLMLINTDIILSLSSMHDYSRYKKNAA